MLINRSSAQTSMLLNRRRLAALALVALAGAAWVYVMPGLLNYLYYYQALGGLRVDVSGMTMSNSSSSWTFSFEFLVTNPSPYAGLGVVSVAYQARLPDDPLAGALGVGSASPGVIIGQYSELRVPATFQVTGPALSSLQEVCKQNTSISWSIEGSLGLDTRDGIFSHQFQIPIIAPC